MNGQAIKEMHWSLAQVYAEMWRNENMKQSWWLGWVQMLNARGTVIESCNHGMACVGKEF